MSGGAKPRRPESEDTISASPNHTPRGFYRRRLAPMRQANSNTLEPNFPRGRSLEIPAAAHAEKKSGVAFQGVTACRVNLRTSMVAKCPTDGNALRSQASRMYADRKARGDCCKLGTRRYAPSPGDYRVTTPMSASPKHTFREFNASGLADGMPQIATRQSQLTRAPQAGTDFRQDRSVASKPHSAVWSWPGERGRSL